MSRQRHYLKTETEYYQAVGQGIKNFELRWDDRSYKIGDMVYLKEVVKGITTGRELGPLEIIYILKGGVFGLKKGWCILGLGVSK